MNIEFDHTCWINEDADWQRKLISLLMHLERLDQHSVRADPELMISWCNKHLPLFSDYFMARLSSGQVRANALNIIVSPTGATAVACEPPWELSADATRELIIRPFRLMLENDRSDRLFVEKTINSFQSWCDRKWISPTMGGGKTMENDIQCTSRDTIAKWRTFYLFDSDRLHPDELIAGWTPPSGDGCQGHSFESLCANIPRKRWHRLDRRSIENYLPQSVLSVKNQAATSVLFGSSVGGMVRFYNFKNGLSGDGVFPTDSNKLVRASRCNGFWKTLSAPDQVALSTGFGRNISNEFNNVNANHSWPADVIAEMDAFADALQDAM